jgi:DNA-binding LacI/PurR family transcriptional regulator
MWVLNERGPGSTIGVNSPILAGLVLGAVTAIGSSPYGLHLYTSDIAASDWRDSAGSSIGSDRYSAFIAAPQWVASGPWWAPIREHHIPLVVINDPHTYADVTVLTDNETGVRHAVSHLRDLGHRVVGNIAGPAGHMEADLRLDAFYRAIANAGMHTPASAVRRADFSIDAGEAAMVDILRANRQDQLPSAIVCGSDLLAIGVLRATTKWGLVVPDELTVVGFDDTALAEVVTPRLTTVRRSLVKLGEAAGRAAARLASGGHLSEARQTITIETELVVRQTSGRPPYVSIP